MSSESQLPITPWSTSVIANILDPNSVRLAYAYVKAREIPEHNIVWVSLPTRENVSESEIIRALEHVRDARQARNIRALAIAWQKPSRVENESITSAFSMGLTHIEFKGNCNLTDLNPIFNAPVGADLQMPLSMMLVGGPDSSDTFDLVAKAGLGDGKNPLGTAYYLRTQDKIRSSPRLMSMINSQATASGRVKIELKEQNDLVGANDIVAYQTGKAVLDKLSTLTFLPGGYADTLTSFSGALANSHGQTTVLAIMKAGATGSFGTVREPCNYADKFPRPDIMLDRYLDGDSLIEAYWKSVSMITEALFVGEPLARPFSKFNARVTDRKLEIFATRFSEPGVFKIFRLDNDSPQLVTILDYHGDAKPDTLIKSVDIVDGIDPKMIPQFGYLRAK